MYKTKAQPDMPGDRYTGRSEASGLYRTIRRWKLPGSREYLAASLRIGSKIKRFIMFYKVCPKCGGYIFIDDDGVSKAGACLNCGYRRELDDHLKPYEPIDKKEPVRMVKL